MRMKGIHIRTVTRFDEGNVLTLSRLFVNVYPVVVQMHAFTASRRTFIRRLFNPTPL